MKRRKALEILLLLAILSILPTVSLIKLNITDYGLNSNISKLIASQFFMPTQSLVSNSSKDYPHQSDDNSRIFWFIQVTDTHLGNSLLNYPPDTWGWSYVFFEDFFTELPFINPDFIVHTGDMVDGLQLIPFYQEPQEWIIYKQLVDDWGMNASIYYDIIGNHDAYGDPSSYYYKTYSVQGRAKGQTSYTWNVTKDYGNYSFIALDSVDHGYYWPAGTMGGLDSARLDWLEQTLNQTKNSNLTFVFTHHPFYEISTVKENKERFMALINEYNVGAHIFGHTHENEQYTYNDTLFLCTSALGVTFPPQYRIIAVDNDGISTALKTLGIWPVVVITSPLDESLTSRTFDLNQMTFPVRALVFNNTDINSVSFQIYNTTLEDFFPNFFVDWASEWNPCIKIHQLNTSGTVRSIFLGFPTDIIT